MLRITLLFCFLIIQMITFAQTASINEISLIPKPVSVLAGKGVFSLTNKTIIFCSDESPELQKVGNYLAARINPSTRFGISVARNQGGTIAGNIYLSLKPGDAQLGDEGYELVINNETVTLTANKVAGLFNGVQTIRQLLPANVESAVPQSGPWEIPAGTIRDYPDFAYRGIMIDVARHFFQVNDIKRMIDLMSAYKMNVLHLHLADDQGWRIEIKKWPKLTEIGGKTQVGGGKGGFYTQEQYSEIVKYAADRYVIVVPEIDMPGHTNAALASYPELNCNNTSPELYTGTKVGFSTLCTSKDITYQFITDVFTELAQITPGPYLHIGGDESHATKLEDFIPFVNRVQKIVAATGKQIIGWDEISLSTIQPNTTVHYWAKAENAQKGVKQGAKVLMSPAAKAYVDMQYDASTKLGLHWAGYVEVETGYNWNPSKLVPGIGHENILGVEAPLWSETITNIHEMEYMFFPRLPGYAEIGWSVPDSRKWSEYKVRLGKQAERFKAMQIEYYPSKQVPWESGKK